MIVLKVTAALFVVAVTAAAVVAERRDSLPLTGLYALLGLAALSQVLAG